MNQVFAVGIAFIITFILWSSKKQSKGSPFLKSHQDYSKNSNTTSSFVQKKKLITQKEPENLKNIESHDLSKQPSLKANQKEKQLTKLISSNPNDRLLAIQIASQWANKKAIPFLRRGLKDSDSRVVIASAAAISSYKGNIINLQKKSQASRLPRNVSLIR